MTDPDAPLAALREFLGEGGFATAGAFMTDLDGTVVLEREGRIYLPPSVEFGLKRVHDHGRLVIANTLRFPLSVIDVFGAEWRRVTGADLPLVSMRGSQIGRVVRSASGQTSFEEWQASTLSEAEIGEVMTGVEGLVDQGVSELLVFFYARDWRQGESIWTPQADRVAPVGDKFRSASKVFSSSVDELSETLLAQPLCMIFLLVDAPQDRLMAYQHIHRNSFFTHRGVGKVDGARAMAAHLGIELEHSIGAGDAPPDDFLSAVGFAVIVGNNDVDYKGLRHTARVDGVAALGDLLRALGDGLDR